MPAAAPTLQAWVEGWPAWQADGCHNSNCGNCRCGVRQALLVVRSRCLPHLGPALQGGLPRKIRARKNVERPQGHSAVCWTIDGKALHAASKHGMKHKCCKQPRSAIGPATTQPLIYAPRDAPRMDHADTTALAARRAPSPATVHARPRRAVLVPPSRYRYLSSCPGLYPCTGTLVQVVGYPAQACTLHDTAASITDRPAQPPSIANTHC